MRAHFWSAIALLAACHLCLQAPWLSPERRSKLPKRNRALPQHRCVGYAEPEPMKADQPEEPVGRIHKGTGTQPAQKAIAKLRDPETMAQLRSSSTKVRAKLRRNKSKAVAMVKSSKAARKLRFAVDKYTPFVWGDSAADIEANHYGPNGPNGFFCTHCERALDDGRCDYSQVGTCAMRILASPKNTETAARSSV